MGKNIYVGNLPFDTTGDDLVELFGVYGPVTTAQVIIDKFSGRSRGFGFVEMATTTSRRPPSTPWTARPMEDAP